MLLYRQNIYRLILRRKVFKQNRYVYGTFNLLKFNYFINWFYTYNIGQYIYIFSQYYLYEINHLQGSYSQT